jgi:hypothetical protein
MRTLHLLGIAALVSGGTLIAARLSGLAVRARSAPVELCSVQALTDRLTPVAGAAVRFDNGTVQTVGVTDADGQTLWHNVDPANGIEIAVSDTYMAGGIALGFIETVIPVPLLDASEDYHFNLISRTQPLAVPIFVEGNPAYVNNIFPPDGDYPHWRIAVPQASTLRMSLNVASLLDADAVAQYMEYRGSPVDPSLGYARGVALVVPRVQLGTGGIVVGIDLLGDLSEDVVVDAYNLYATPSVEPLGTPLGVTVAAFENGVVYVLVTGGVRHGHLALLARSADAGPAQIHKNADNPPTITVPASGDQGTDTAAVLDCVDCDEAVATSYGSAAGAPRAMRSIVTNCEPDVPDTGNWTCAPLAPAANHCGAPVSAGPVECQIVSSRTARFCRDPGMTMTGSTGRTAKWKVSFELKVSPPGSPLTSGGGFEYGEESSDVVTDSWTAGAGAHGLGQCMRYYRFELVCAQLFSLQVDKIEWIANGYAIIDRCASTKLESGSCRDTDISSSVCDRTP